jgi:Xaa-Pro dipeptidase
MINSVKLHSLRNLMKSLDVQSLLIQKVSNFAWLTDGAESYVGIASDCGPSSIFITDNNLTLLTNNIELLQLQDVQGLDSIQVLTAPWYEGMLSLVPGLIEGKLASDYHYPGAIIIDNKISNLRVNLSDTEITKYKELGSKLGRIYDKISLFIKPGMSEYEIAGKIANLSLEEGANAIVNLVAVDDRIARYRHPLPTFEKLKNHVQLVIGLRKWGLVASASRAVYFGKTDNIVLEQGRICRQVDSNYISLTRPGKSLNDIFNSSAELYKKFDFEENWKLHHQGGATGYLSREVLADYKNNFVVGVHQAYAWNPIVGSSKSEDTIIVAAHQNEIITSTKMWPIDKNLNVPRSELLVIT